MGAWDHFMGNYTEEVSSRPFYLDFLREKRFYIHNYVFFFNVCKGERII